MKNIVTQLRANSECLAPSIMLEAADEIDRLREERDQARREILLWVKERCSWVEMTQEIKKRGWEYLKEDGK
jgi:hypothetical protein